MTAGVDFSLNITYQEGGTEPIKWLWVRLSDTDDGEDRKEKWEESEHHTLTRSREEEEEREEITTSKRKRTPFLIYTGRFLLAPVGCPQPNRDLRINHGTPETEGKT